MLVVTILLMCYHGAIVWENKALYDQVSFFKKRLWAIIGIITVTATIVAVAWATYYRHKPFFPIAITETATSYTLFEPRQLPTGYTVDKESFSRAANVLTFTAVNSEKQHINFSIQSRPPNYDYNSFYSAVLKDTFKFTTSEGEAAIGKAQGLTVGSLLTASTWVIVSSSTKSVTTNDIQQVLSHLEPEQRR
jgi:hypothetical protein